MERTSSSYDLEIASGDLEQNFCLRVPDPIDELVHSFYDLNSFQTKGASHRVEAYYDSLHILYVFARFSFRG